MLPALLSSHSKSCFYAALLSILYLQQWMPCHRQGWYQLWKPQLCELSLPSHAQAGQWGKTSLQKPFLSSQLYHFLILHCLMFSAFTDHTSALCFWALDAIPSKQSKAGQYENKCQRDLLKPTQKWSSSDLRVPSDPSSENIEELL